ncbi:DUF262 domain-containing protein [Hymenobacter sp. 102]|uniref:DUF262 domain-containing protein n=1 Tax=Hymenobacter sp. 102 TaxID=3403152 RepID=UPI003CE88BB8
MHKKISNLQTLLFSQERLRIPPYQRPYKWSTRQVNQLIDDILYHRERDKSAYRLGTVVVHYDRGHSNQARDVVDGQQRLYTLSLLAAALLRRHPAATPAGKQAADLCLAQSCISNPISQANLRRNAQLIQQRVEEFQREDADFFFQRCELVYLELEHIAEAFQFFDSQNTRGKDLAPHDLLKAYHLREMESNTEAERIASAGQWEQLTEDLPRYFSSYLFKIRAWSKGRSGLHFTKERIDTFKGLTIGSAPVLPFAEAARMCHLTVQGYNQDHARVLDRQRMPYPCQLDQVILNGARFFEYVGQYAARIRELEARVGDPRSSVPAWQGGGMAKRILHELAHYWGRGRQGDQYVRNLFDCCLLYYWDKFGDHKEEEAVVRIFLWAYALRLENKAVRAVTVDNYAKAQDGLIRLIREATDPREFFAKSLTPVNHKGSEGTVAHLDGIMQLFRDLKAIE